MTVAVCFALLQALQPFIHAHLGSEHHSHAEGLHTAEFHESVHALEHSNNHTMLDASHGAHTISVSQGIKQDSTYAVDDTYSFVLIAICFALLVILNPQYPPQSTSNFIKSLKRRLPASRAPPYF